MDYGRALKGELLMNSQPWVPYAQPLLDAVNLFEALNLGYALIGGVASMYYGRSRFTEDVDFVVNGICVLPMARVWKDEHAAEIISRAMAAELAGRFIRVIEPHDLIAMKLRTARLIDDYDISQIVLNTAIDESRLSSMVTPEQFQHFVDIKKRK